MGVINNRLEEMKIYQRQLEECYRKLEQAEQVGKTRELGKVIDKIQLINTIDDLIHKKSEEMRRLVEEVSGDIDDLARRHHIFWYISQLAIFTFCHDGFYWGTRRLGRVWL